MMKIQKILYASGFSFQKRTPNNSHATIKDWIKSLEELEKIPYSISFRSWYSNNFKRAYKRDYFI